MIRIEHRKYAITTKHPFGTAHGIRLATPAILIRVNYMSQIGYGEASIPPYYPETQDSVIAFLHKLNLEQYSNTTSLKVLLSHIHSREGNYAAKNAIDSSLHDAWAKSKKVSLQEALLGPLASTMRHSSFTIGLDRLDVMIAKCKEASSFKTLKIKLDGKNDIQTIGAIQSITDQELMVDANQSWTSVEESIAKAKALHKLGVTLIEQPFKTGAWEKNKSLKENSPIPIYADEDIQGIKNLDLVSSSYDGINVKLMKCGGVSQAIKLIKNARELGLKVMLGCMTETSCGISTASQIASLADHLDLDGNLLLSNDPYQATATKDGVIYVDTTQHGIGLIDDSKIWSSPV